MTTHHIGSTSKRRPRVTVQIRPQRAAAMEVEVDAAAMQGNDTQEEIGISTNRASSSTAHHRQYQYPPLLQHHRQHQHHHHQQQRRMRVMDYHNNNMMIDGEEDGDGGGGGSVLASDEDEPYFDDVDDDYTSAGLGIGIGIGVVSPGGSGSGIGSSVATSAAAVGHHRNMLISDRRNDMMTDDHDQDMLDKDSNEQHHHRHPHHYRGLSINTSAIPSSSTANDFEVSSPLYHRDFPEDALLCMFYFLDRRELLTKIGLVSHRWRSMMVSCTLLWHHHTFCTNPYYYLQPKRVLLGKIGSAAATASASASASAAGSAATSEPGSNHGISSNSNGSSSSSSADHATTLERVRDHQKSMIRQEAQMYPVDKTMWREYRTGMHLQEGTWTFVNYREYFMEQCLLEKCSVSGLYHDVTGLTPMSPTTALALGGGGSANNLANATTTTPSTVTPTPTTPGGTNSSLFRRVMLSMGGGNSSNVGASSSSQKLFCRDQATEDVLLNNRHGYPRMPHTYRHTLTVVPSTPESLSVRYRGISRNSFILNSDNSDPASAAVTPSSPVPTLCDQRSPSEAVYLIGGLHNTLTTQPPEASEDFVRAIEIVDRDRFGQGNYSATPTSPGGSGSLSPSSPITPIAQGIRRLFYQLGSAGENNNAHAVAGGNGNNSATASASTPLSPLRFNSPLRMANVAAHDKMSGFKHVAVQGKPPHLGKHSAVHFDDYDVNGHRGPKILVFAGVENELVTNHVYHFDVKSSTWFREHYAPGTLVPVPRTNHASVAVDEYMYVIGGGLTNNMVPTNEIWRYHIHEHRWEMITNLRGDGAAAFTPRLGTVVCAINKRVLIYGGGYWHQTSLSDRYWREKYRDLFILDTVTNTMTAIDFSHSAIAPQVGTFPACALVGTQWFVIGGAFDNKISQDIYALDTVTYQWRRFEERFYGGDSLHACHFVNCELKNKILVCGGFCYHPLEYVNVFSLRYKDQMDAARRFSCTKIHFRAQNSV